MKTRILGPVNTNLSVTVKNGHILTFSTSVDNLFSKCWKVSLIGSVAPEPPKDNFLHVLDWEGTKLGN
jgi:hypothetical protein